MKSLKTISFIIPAYNEEKTILDILDKLEKIDFNLEKEIIVVNDCSADKTWEILQEYKEKHPIRIFKNENNLGKSQTVKRGIIESTGDLVVIQDADLEYDPTELTKFVTLFLENKADVVYGNRFGKNNKIVYLQNWIGNTLLSFISALITGMRSRMWTRDMEVCYKMSRGNIFREIAKTIESTSTFGLEPELTAKFSKYKLDNRHLRFEQIPISYYPRTIEDGKKMNAFKDGIKALLEIIKFNIKPLDKTS